MCLKLNLDIYFHLYLATKEADVRLCPEVPHWGNFGWYQGSCDALTDLRCYACHSWVLSVLDIIWQYYVREYLTLLLQIRWSYFCCFRLLSDVIYIFFLRSLYVIVRNPSKWNGSTFVCHSMKLTFKEIYAINFNWKIPQVDVNLHVPCGRSIINAFLTVNNTVTLFSFSTTVKEMIKTKSSIVKL